MAISDGDRASVLMAIWSVLFGSVLIGNVLIGNVLIGSVLGETEAGELPAGGGWEEVAIGGADVRRGCDAGASAKDDLAGHEFAVVLA